MLIQIPIGEDAFSGVVDLVRMRALIFGESIEDPPTEADIPAAVREDAELAREQLIETLADARRRDRDEVPRGRRDPGARARRRDPQGDASGVKIVPVLCGTALRNKGIHPLLDAVVDYLPSPARSAAGDGRRPFGQERGAHARPQGLEPLSLLAFKIAMDEGRKIVFVRVFSGVLEAGVRDPQRARRTRRRRSRACS